MDTTTIDSAIDAAYTAALLNSARVVAHPVGTDPSQVVRVDIYSSPEGFGFQVVGQISVGGYVATRVRQHGPQVQREKAWPTDIETEAKKWIADSIVSGEKFIEAQGYGGIRVTVILNMHLLAKAAYGTEQAFDVAKPKLFAVKNWLLQVQSQAASGKRFFTASPYPFEDVVTER